MQESSELNKMIDELYEQLDTNEYSTDQSQTDEFDLSNNMYRAKGVDFRGCQLKRVSFEKRTMIDANFKMANLTDSVLKFADLERSRFDRANLSGSLCQYANFENTSFVGANLTNVNFYGAILKAADLSKTITTSTYFAKCIIDQKTKLPFSRSEAIRRGCITIETHYYMAA